MRVKQLRAVQFKRFNDLTVTGLSSSTRLVVLTGPNGSGKSSLFDAFMEWHKHRGRGGSLDPLYSRKQGASLPSPDGGLTQDIHMVEVEFFNWSYDSIQDRPNAAAKAFYIRSAYRNQPDFTTVELRRIGTMEDENRRIERMIDNDVRVELNYQRLVSETISLLYSGNHDRILVNELRDKIIGQIRDSMGRIFGDLVLSGLGHPLQNGSFFFEKGISRGFHYKNLSGGEKAAFDLVLDLVLKRAYYEDTVYCIDEPEAHMSTKLQGRLLEELVQLIPDGCQLWVATHSIGMMRKARELQEAAPNEVAFLDFHDKDFDQPVTLTPSRVDRRFWANTLTMALDDLAQLVAPRQVVLCEGRPATMGASSKAEFDARCYRTIFAAEFPDVDFISVGSQSEVTEDRLGVAQAIQMILPNTKVVRLVDHDDRSDEEVTDLLREGVRVLSRRHLESYLLDDEVLTRLCISLGRPDKVAEVLTAKQQAWQTEVEDRLRPPDEIKAAAGVFYVAAKQILRLTGRGNTAETFLRDTLAPLITPDAQVYAELKRDVFGTT